MSRVHNFSAGPAALPVEVLQQIKRDIPDWKGLGMSVMEVSHRSKEFIELATQAERNARELLSISDDYSVMFVQGGATLQFAMAALNLSTPTDTVDYVLTGSWGKKAAKEAARYSLVNIAADAVDGNYAHIPDESEWQTTADAAYLHYTPNETIGGVEFHFVPKPADSAKTPLVADMSSNILSRPVDVSQHGVIYAGAQKNVGPAGITLLIVRNDLLDRARADTPTLLTYKVYAESGSMANTPPTFAWYVTGLVFEYLLGKGGLSAMAEVNNRKSNKLYGAIDASGFYSNPVRPDCRSRMNVPFVLANPELDERFISGANDAGLTNLKGHRSVGGMRASIYNATGEGAIDALINYMQDFECRYG
jgi:phosphoserine aminotransferase